MLVVENGETGQVAEMPLYKEIRLPSKPSTKKLEPLDSTWATEGKQWLVLIDAPNGDW